MITVDKGVITSFFSVRDRIRSFNNGKLPCVSVIVSLCLKITKPLQILLKIYMHIKAKILHFFNAKRLKIGQNQEKSTAHRFKCGMWSVLFLKNNLSVFHVFTHFPPSMKKLFISIFPLFCFTFGAVSIC